MSKQHSNPEASKAKDEGEKPERLCAAIRDFAHPDGGERVRFVCARPLGHKGEHALILHARHVEGSSEHRAWLDGLAALD